MKKWNMVIDVAKCENCNNCFLATKDEHVGNDFPGYAAPQPLHDHSWVAIRRKVRGSGSMVDAAYLTTMCNHCDDAPCVKAARDDSMYKRPDGIVIIDPVKAKGRRDLVKSCPYGEITYNDELDLPQKWIFDAHLLDQGWEMPRIVQVCPTGALQSMHVEDAEMTAYALEHKLEVLLPHAGTRPRVYYRNLHRFMKAFVGGSIVAKINGVTECVQGATATLMKDGRNIGQIKTDMFGDFKFDALDPDSGRYEVEVTHPTYGRAAANAEIGDSCYIGTINLLPN